MAGTLADMITRISSEISRPDLAATQIPNAINTAIDAYSSERFSFSEQAPDGTYFFNTVAGQAVYTATDYAKLGTLMKIDVVNLNIGTASIIELDRDTPENLIIYNQQAGTMAGQPTWYAFENGKLILSAIPDQVYKVTLGLFVNPAAPATTTEANNPWMIAAETLIRSRAKYEIALNVTRNEKMMALMSPDAPTPGMPVGAAYREWKRLKGVGNRQTGRGIIRPMQF